MVKITIIVVVLAFVYCAEANPNLFDMFNLDPERMQADIRNQIKEMMDPNYLKNQGRDGNLMAATVILENGKPSYEFVLAQNKGGVYSGQRYKGPQ